MLSKRRCTEEYMMALQPLGGHFTTSITGSEPLNKTINVLHIFEAHSPNLGLH